MHINEKGQVTIPKDVREKFGFLPNTEVLFEEVNNKIYLVKAVESKRRGKTILRALRKKGDINYTTDEIMQYARG
jgi:AbrB family looped-hinge helix DNA binding protein